MNIRNTVPDSIQKIFEQSFVTTNEQRLDEAYQTLDPILAEVEKIDIIINSGENNELKMNEIAAHKEAIYIIVRDMWRKPIGWDFLDIYADFLDGVQDMSEELPEFLKEEQTIDRFRALADDKWYIRFKKFVKNKAYYISILPKKTINRGLKIFKKNPKPIPLWHHKIPIRGVVKKVYQTDLVKSLTEPEQKKYIAFLQIIISLKAYENNVDLILTNEDNKIGLKKLSSEDSTQNIEAIRNNITANKNTNLETISATLASTNQVFKEVMDKASTMELSGRHLDSSVLNRRFTKINNSWLSNSEGWSRTLYVLFDDWRLDFEINRLKHFAYSALFKASKQLVSEKNKYQKRLVRVADALGNV